MRASAVIAFTLLLRAGAANAQQSPAPNVSVRRATRTADEAFEQRDYEGALELYQAAFRNAPTPALRLRLADCYEALGRPREAVYHLERFLEEDQDGTRDEVDAVIRHAAQLRQAIATLRVRVTPSDAFDLLVTVDGLTISPNGVAPVGAGMHTVEVAADGYRSARVSVTVSAGGTLDVPISLQRNDFIPIVANPSAATSRPQGMSSGAFFALLGATLTSTAVWATSGLMALDARSRHDAAVTALRAGGSAAQRQLRDETRSQMERLALLSDVALGLSIAGAIATAVVGARTDFRAPRVELDARALPGGGALGLRGRF